MKFLAYMGAAHSARSAIKGDLLQVKILSTEPNGLPILAFLLVILGSAMAPLAIGFVLTLINLVSTPVH